MSADEPAPFVCLPFPSLGFILWRSGVKLNREAAETMLGAFDVLVMSKDRPPVTIDPLAGREWLSRAMVEMGWLARSDSPR